MGWYALVISTENSCTPKTSMSTSSLLLHNDCMYSCWVVEKFLTSIQFYDTLCNDKFPDDSPQQKDVGVAALQLLLLSRNEKEFLAEALWNLVSQSPSASRSKEIYLNHWHLLTEDWVKFSWSFLHPSLIGLLKTIETINQCRHQIVMSPLSFGIAVGLS